MHGNRPHDTATVVSPSGRHIYTLGELGLTVLEMPPYLKSITQEGQNVSLTWEGFGPVRLQRATSLTRPDWQDLLGSETTNSTTLPIWSGSEFFRLVRP